MSLEQLMPGIDFDREHALVVVREAAVLAWCELEDTPGNRAFVRDVVFKAVQSWNGGRPLELEDTYVLADARAEVWGAGAGRERGG